MKEPFEAAKAYAITLLSKRSYTSKKLYDKISSRYGEDESAAAVARAAELGLIDDEDYARRYLSDLLKLKGMSKRRAAQELRRIGIDGETAGQVLSEAEDEPELMIARVIKRRYMRQLNDEKGRKRTFNALLRLGYGRGDILMVMRNIETDEDYYEKWE